MIPKFNPSNANPSSVDFVEATLEESNQWVDNYYDYIKSVVLGEGMGSLTSSDLEIFYRIMLDPKKYSKENISRLLTLIEQAASAERFEKIEDARECVRMIATYREEMDL
jgi:hypothetical protein